MKIPDKLATGILLLLMTFGAANAQNPTAKDASANQAKIQSIIAKMTLDQKAQLVIGTGMFFELPDSIRKKMPAGFGGKLIQRILTMSAWLKRSENIFPARQAFHLNFLNWALHRRF